MSSTAIEVVGSSRDVVGAVVVVDDDSVLDVVELEAATLVFGATDVDAIDSVVELVVDEALVDVVVPSCSVELVVFPWVVEVVDGTLELEDVVVTFQPQAFWVTETLSANATDKPRLNAVNAFKNPPSE